MQSATSDVNAGILEYRRMLTYAQSTHNISGAISSIRALNGILPPELQLRFNNEGYREQESDIFWLKCPACKGEAELDFRRTYTKVSTPRGMGQYTGVDPELHTYRVYYDCTAERDGKPCGNPIQVIHDEEHMRIVPASEVHDGRFAVKFAPEMPRMDSLYDQMQRGGVFWDWVSLVGALLETQLRLFRKSMSQPLDAGDGTAVVQGVPGEPGMPGMPGMPEGPGIGAAPT